MKKYAFRIDVWNCGRLLASHRICADTEEKAIEYFEACSRWGGHNPMFTLTIGRKENLLND